MSVAKATAAMSANSTPSTTSNMDAQREGFFDQCVQFGTNAGAGDTSKVGWFEATCEAAWQGIIAPGVRRKKGDTTSPPSDAERAYTAYADARKAKAGEMGKRIAGKDGKDFKTRVSEANRMITLGSLPDIHDTSMGGFGVFQRTLRIIRDDAEVTGQVDDLLLEVARRQCDEPKVALTDDQIKAILTPDEPPEAVPREEVEMWGSVLKRIETIMNTHYPDSAGQDPQAKTARNSVARRIDALGGTEAMVKAREKAAEEDRKRKEAAKVQRQGARRGGKKP